MLAELLLYTRLFCTFPIAATDAYVSQFHTILHFLVYPRTKWHGVQPPSKENNESNT